jgi:Arc/MetJ-type ribon-helix-helix transcriptional regulator
VTYILVTLLSNISLVSVARPCYVPYGCLSLGFRRENNALQTASQSAHGRSTLTLDWQKCKVQQGGFSTCLGQTGAKPAQTSIRRERIDVLPYPSLSNANCLRVTTIANNLQPFLNPNMAVLNPRSRMISVRLSEEEYSALRQLCSDIGARSVSDLTRDAMRVLLNGAGREEALGIHVNEFRSQMRSLDRKIEQLAADITSLKANGNQ